MGLLPAVKPNRSNLPVRVERGVERSAIKISTELPIGRSSLILSSLAFLIFYFGFLNIFLIQIKPRSYRKASQVAIKVNKTFALRSASGCLHNLHLPEALKLKLKREAEKLQRGIQLKSIDVHNLCVSHSNSTPKTIRSQ